MLFRSKKLIGLDIGSSSIKVAELDASRKKAVLTGFALIPTPPNTLLGGDILEPYSLSQAVAAVVAELKSKRKAVGVGLWGTAIIVKKISIPRMDEKLIGEQIRWEAEQYIPFDINEVNLDYKVLKKTNSSPETMDILLIAARQETVFKYVEVVETAGLHCSVLDVGGFSLANCFEKNYGTVPGQVCVLLNMGASVINIVVVDQGEVTFCRDIPVGGDTYTGDIQKTMNMSLQEAESMKLSASTGQAIPDEVMASIQNTNEMICDEIQGSIDFYLNTTSEGRLDRLFITGGGSRTPGLLSLMGERLKLPCEIMDPFLSIGYDAKKLDAHYVSEIRDFAAIAMGLGLRKEGDS